MAMGAADVIPGVSGGTIAFITGIYQRLINAIKAVDLEALKLLLGFQFKAFWGKIDGFFLIILFGGIITSVLSLAKLITFLLANHPILLWSFFFGLIIISSLLIGKEIRRWKIADAMALLIGGALAFFITMASPAQTPDGLWFIFISGVIAITAMILPGISGSFLLVILSKYQYMMQALSNVDIPVIAVFILGCVTGLLSFSRLIAYLLKNYYNLTIALLCGFMLGSLNKVWPWKVVVETYLDRHGEVKPLVEKNVLPWNYLELTGIDPLFLQALLFAALGLGAVVVLEKLGNYFRQDG
jgi:putative membrane protein